MREEWIEIIKLNMEKIEGQSGLFRNKTASTEHPFTIEYTVRILLGAGELAPYVAAPHQHPVFDKGIPAGGDIILDTNHPSFLIVRLQSHDVSGTPPNQRVTSRNHTHFIPWGKLRDIEFTEIKQSLPS